MQRTRPRHPERPGHAQARPGLDQAQAVLLSFASGNVDMEATGLAAALLEVDEDLRELVRAWGVAPPDAAAALRGA